jgi:hypothetical protein
MEMFKHDDIAENNEPVSSPCLLEDLQKEVATVRYIQKQEADYGRTSSSAITSGQRPEPSQREVDLRRADLGASAAQKSLKAPSKPTRAS